MSYAERPQSDHVDRESIPVHCGRLPEESERERGLFGMTDEELLDFEESVEQEIQARRLALRGKVKGVSPAVLRDVVHTAA